MKKWLKITLISLGSLVGLLLIVVAVACWLVFTPARLTSIVNSLADKYVDAETHFGKVDLTLFKTFPDAGIEIHDVYVVNPTDGAPSDTLARLSSLTVGVDVREYLKNKNIIVRQLCLGHTDANIYIAPDGSNNFSIFASSDDDTTGSEPFQLPEEIDISKVAINDFNCRFVDAKDGLNAAIERLDLSLAASLQRAEEGDAKVRMKVRTIDFAQLDSLQQESLAAVLHDIGVKIDGKGTLQNLDGRVRLTLPKASVALAGTQYINEALDSSREDLLQADLPFLANLDEMTFSTTDAELSIDKIMLCLTGRLAMANERQPMQVAVDFATNKITVSEILPYLPEAFTDWQKEMTVDAVVALDGHAEGIVSGDTLPVVSCNVQLSNGRFASAMLPAPVQKIAADLSATLDLSQQTPSFLQVRSLQAAMNSNRLTVKGRVDDLMGNMRIDADLKGDLVIAELMPFIPDSLPVDAQGNAKLNLHAKTTLKQLTNMDVAHMKASGTLVLSNLEAVYDSIEVAAPQLEVALSLPSGKNRLHSAELAEVKLSGPSLDVKMPSAQTAVTLANTNVVAAVSNILEKNKPIEAALELALERADASVDTIIVGVEGLKVQGTVNYDSTRGNILNQLDPRLNVAFARTTFFTPQMPEAVRLASFQFDYKPDRCEIAEADIHWGLSDYHLSGTVQHLEDWLDHTRSLDADINFTSDYTDVDQLLSLISGMGSDADSLELMRQEDSVPAEANPFIVPLDMDVALHTHIKRCMAFGNSLSDLAGNISVRDGKAILDQVGFVCKAARMQLTGIYKSPRPNHLYLGADFHLLDIQVDELIDMIPYVDTLIPMLKSFSGQADFHLALEGYLNARYEPKMSTLLGSTAISGKDLVVLPGETFDQIAKYLMFSKKTVNKIDSLDVEMTLFRNKLTVYPFMLSMDKYQVCVSGVQALDNACNYHLELLKSPLPVRLAVDVTGKLPKPKVGLGTVKYKDLYKPEKTNAVKQRTLEIKKMVREALEANVR